MKKISVVFLTVILLICMVSAGVFAENTKSNDPSTLSEWKGWFGNTTDTQNAGGVWLDKTVLPNTTALTDELGVVECIEGIDLTMDNSNDNFLVTLSAMGNNKSIKGYSYIPTDTFLVLDVSGSMVSDKDYITPMVSSANAAIDQLLKLNNHNRVGVVLYSGSTQSGDSSANTATVLLPLGRYKISDITNNDSVGNAFLQVSYRGDEENLEPQSIKINPALVQVNADGTTTTVSRTSKNVSGGTYIQNGLYKAMNEMLNADPTIPDGEAQAGTTRIPIVVLMSDGAPTTGTSSYTSVGRSNMGNGMEASEDISFVTQLTAAYVKEKLDAKYEDSSPRFYTLGLGVGGSNFAECVMDPSVSPNGIDEDWAALIERGRVTISGNRTIVKDALLTAESQNYVDQYFPANNVTELGTAFSSIVNEIIIQSKYYASDVDQDANFEGYFSFIDNLGANMEVKSVKGLVLGDLLYDGATFAKCFVPGESGGALGTYDNPTDLGNTFILAVKERLGIEDTSAARTLVGLAYDYGQLYYKDHSDFGNRISIYTDENNKYLGFCDEDFDEPVPHDAKYKVDTYGYIDTSEAEASLAQGNLLYISVAVRTDLSTGEVSVLWDIPASMMPMLTREFTIEGNNLDDPGEITMTSNEDDVLPIRLIYEVGVMSDITPINIVEKLGDNNRNADGTYTFITNAWNASELESSSDVYEHPSAGTNAVGYFHPNEMNERYYYTENTPVWVSDGNGGYKEYSGESQPSGSGYYRALGVFSWNENGENIKYSYKYEPIMTNALAETYRSSDNIWYVPMGTARGRADDQLLKDPKTANNTETLSYSHYGSFEYFHEDLTEVDDEGNTVTTQVPVFIADCILGNNGKLIYEPATGIKISKTLQEFDPDVEAEFTFNVEGASLDGTYNAVHVDANGTETATTVVFTDGKSADIKLKRNEEFYLIGLPAGTYTVTEAATEGYEFVSVNGSTAEASAQVTVTSYELASADFVNTLDVTGGFIIRKTVEHPFDEDYQIPDSVKFKFEVNVGASHAGHKIKVAGEETTVPASGIITVEVGANSSILLTGLDPNESVTVTELMVGMPSGFAPSDEDYTEGSYSKVVEITEDDNTVVTFNNKYTPSKVEPVNVLLSGTKTLNGRNWQLGDEFIFVLEYHDVNAETSQWKEVGRASVTPSSPDYMYDLSSALSEQEFTKAGTYAYRVRELSNSIGGITYDVGMGYFNIIVGDSDMDGAYEILSVDGYERATVTENTEVNTYQVDIDFSNSYAATGPAVATIPIKKNFSALEGSHKNAAGYTFGLYSADDPNGEPVAKSAVTDSDGETKIEVVYSARDIGHVYNYIVKEIIPADADISIDYDTTEYPIAIQIVDNFDGTAGTVVLDNSGAVVDKLSFTNAEVDIFKKSVKDSADITADGAIVSVGDELTYTITYQNVHDVAQNVTITDDIPAHTSYVEGSVDQNGVYADGKITWTLNVPAGESVNVSFKVTVDESADLKNEATAIVNNHTITSNPVTTKVYTPTAPVTIGGTKNLTGRDIVDGEFTFVLYENDAEVDRVTNVADKFTFAPITYNAPGTYTYTVKELAGNTFGVTYDTASYEVKVTVTADADGKLTAAVSGADALTFNNSYGIGKPEKTVVDNAGLTVDGKTVALGDVLTYKVTYDNVTGHAAQVVITDTIPEHTTLVENSISNGGTLTNGVITWNFDSVAAGEKAEVSFRVRVVEIAPVENTAKAVVNGVEITSNPVTTKVYAPVSVDLKGTKALVGRDLTAGEFEFVVTTAAGDEVTTGTNAADGSITFAPIELVAPGEYVFTVSEVNDGALGVIYDTASYKVKVVVAANEEGKLTATVSGADALAFNNTYSVGTPQKSVFNEEGSSVDGKSVGYGELLTYKISYLNVTGSVANVTISDDIPVHTSYVEGSATAGGVYADGTVTWIFEDVAVDAAVEVSFQVKVDEVATIENQAVATISKGDAEIKSNKVTTTVETVLNREDHFGYIIGYPEHYQTGEYTTDQTVMPVKPEGMITRAEVATIYFRMLKDDKRAEAWTQENPYADVQITDWFNNAVSVLSNLGILKGDPTGNFRPNDPITRAEFAAIASRFYASTCDCESDHFSDIDTHWASDEINKAAHNNLILGDGDGTYRPDDPIKRCEAVTIVNRTLERAPSKDHFLPDMLKWVDNMDTKAWYYAEMQEATNSHEYEKLTDTGGKVYEVWTKMLPIRDWAAFEKEWSNANSAENPGDVARSN